MPPTMAAAMHRKNQPQPASPPSFGTMEARANAATSGVLGTTSASTSAQLMVVAFQSTQSISTM